jgi:glycosyltransferase involved in cell wall biosynthesis
MTEGRNVLFLSYLFPPIGGAGVQRNLKYVKYLPRFGWNPIVVTVKDIVYHVYDESLFADLPPDIRIFRTESFDPLRLSAVLMPHSKATMKRDGSGEATLWGRDLAVRAYRGIRDYIAIPDVQIGWVPFAVAAGLRLIRRYPVDVIYARSIPLSSTLVAHILSRITSIPYVLDFADAWTDDPYFIMPTKLHRKVHEFLERTAVGKAHGVTTYSEFLERILVTRYPSLAGRVQAIPNGFDSDDFKEIARRGQPGGKNEIVYMGTLNTHHAENFESLLEALKSLPSEISQSLRITFVGSVFEKAIADVKKAGLRDLVEFTGYLAHKQALQHLTSASAGLLFVRSGDTSSVTGKVFEYLGARIPIIACAEREGLCADILRKAGIDEWITPPGDPIALAGTISRLAEKGWPRPDSWKLDQFERSTAAQSLAKLFERVAAK